MRRGVWGLGLGLWLWMAPVAAQAAGVPGTPGYVPDALDAEPFRPALDPGGLLTTESPAVAGRSSARADVWAAHNLLLWTPESGDAVALIGDTMTLHLAAGRTLGRTRIALSAPLHLLAGSETFDVPALIAGDVRLSVKRPLTGWLAVQGDLSAGMGGDAYQLGSSAPRAEASLAAGRRGEQRALLANLGVRLQQATTLQTLSDGDLSLGNAAWYRVGVAQTLNPAHTLEMTAELHGAIASGSISGQPLEAMLGLQQQPPPSGRDDGEREGDGGGRVRVGLGVGLRPGIGAPAWRLLVGVGHEQAAPPAPVAAPALSPGDLLPAN